LNTNNRQKSSFDPELLINLLVLDRVVPQLLVETEALGCFDDARGKHLGREHRGSIAETRKNSGYYLRDHLYAAFDSNMREESAIVTKGENTSLRM